MSKHTPGPGHGSFPCYFTESSEPPACRYVAAMHDEMLAALKAARAYIADFANSFIECNSMLDQDLNPVPGTMDADAQAIADEERVLLEAIDAAIAKAEGKA